MARLTVRIHRITHSDGLLAFWRWRTCGQAVEQRVSLSVRSKIERTLMTKITVTCNANQQNSKLEKKACPRSPARGLL